MKLEVGKLYEVTTDDEFYSKPTSKERTRNGFRYTTWPVVYADPEMQHWHLYKKHILFLGTEFIYGDELNKFLWNNNYVYIRYFTPIEYEYRFEEVKIQ